ncbi:hypothetical protein Fmac_009598 [Flemingia macrophylla]|uniref:protein-serine/threonine phosphatase n=1 Tax=Flemingia macrophylla TaxID=520843 RepID=A0ABD1N1Z0_9FABA
MGKPLGLASDDATAGIECRDGLLCFRDIGRLSAGDFSLAVIQANQVLEDQWHIQSGTFGTFLGVYDGHGGPDCSRYVCDNLLRNLQGKVLSPVFVYIYRKQVDFFCAAALLLAKSRSVVTAEDIQQAFQRTEEGFTALVSEQWSSRPQITTSGTCCLVGVICRQTLFVASLGDSRAVLGRRVGNTGGVAAIQLSTEHNVNIEAVRRELKELHPDDPQIVVLQHGVWRVKGILQVSRSIGDVYMKHAQFNREPINAKFRLPEPMNMPFLSANPTIISHPLQPNDSFLIFASDGLWEHLSNDQAVEIVHSNPRAGSAKRLVKAALKEAARKREMKYSVLDKIDKVVRRHFHDDITVIVLYLNHDLICRRAHLNLPLTIRSALDH